MTITTSDAAESSTSVRLRRGVSALVLALSLAGAVQAQERSAPTATATLRNFISPDPLAGDNGMPPSPAAPANYGPINLALDVDGNAIEATSTADVAFFDGRYYLYAPSYACGSFDYAPGANMTPTLRTQPPSFYRYCGLATYESRDLMNWRLVDRLAPQDPQTGRVFPIKKARVLYSAKTKRYVMWFANGQGGPYGGTYYMESMTPHGPWSQPQPIGDPIDPTRENLRPDFDLGTGPNNETWMATSHGAIRVFRVNEEKTAVVEQLDVKVPPTVLNGGIGIHHENGWWYVTGGPSCANCVAAPFAYIMARDPRGPWISPVSGKAGEPVEPGVLSQDSGNAQSNGSSQLPDGRGGTRTLIPFKHYVATSTKAPTGDRKQPGDANLALSGLWLYPLEHGADGRIEPMKVVPESSFPLAAPVTTTPPPAYQADLSITGGRAVAQRWRVPPRTRVAAVLPAVFQRTRDDRPAVVPDKPFTSLEEVRREQAAQRARGIVLRAQDAAVNAPLIATLRLPDGSTQRWTIDPRTIAWSPHAIALNLTRPYAAGGDFELRLETTATNGGYGVAVGPALPGGRYTHAVGTAAKTFEAGMALRTSATPVSAPKITVQPRSVSVREGDEAGFVVQASGVGLGYQWLHDGKIITAPDGQNESTAMTMRIDDVSAKDAGVYTVQVLNQAGSVTSRAVRLDVLPKAAKER